MSDYFWIKAGESTNITLKKWQLNWTLHLSEKNLSYNYRKAKERIKYQGNAARVRFFELRCGLKAVRNFFFYICDTCVYLEQKARAKFSTVVAFSQISLNIILRIYKSLLLESSL